MPEVEWPIKPTWQKNRRSRSTAISADPGGLSSSCEAVSCGCAYLRIFRGVFYLQNHDTHTHTHTSRRKLLTYLVTQIYGRLVLPCSLVSTALYNLLVSDTRAESKPSQKMYILFHMFFHIINFKSIYWFFLIKKAFEKVNQMALICWLMCIIFEPNIFSTGHKFNGDWWPAISHL